MYWIDKKTGDLAIENMQELHDFIVRRVTSHEGVTLQCVSLNQLPSEDPRYTTIDDMKAHTMVKQINTILKHLQVLETAMHTQFPEFCEMREFVPEPEPEPIDMLPGTVIVLGFDDEDAEMAAVQRKLDKIGKP